MQAKANFGPVLQCTERGHREGVEARSRKSSAEDEIDCEVVLLSTSRKLSIPFRVIDVERIFVKCKN
jgi:hypothetical protein